MLTSIQTIQQKMGSQLFSSNNQLLRSFAESLHFHSNSAHQSPNVSLIWPRHVMYQTTGFFFHLSSYCFVTLFFHRPNACPGPHFSYQFRFSRTGLPTINSALNKSVLDMPLGGTYHSR